MVIVSPETDRGGSAGSALTPVMDGPIGASCCCAAPPRSVAALAVAAFEQGFAVGPTFVAAELPLVRAGGLTTFGPPPADSAAASAAASRAAASSAPARLASVL